MELNKETQWWTTNYRTAQVLRWIGFYYTKTLSANARELFVFDKSEELIDTFNFYQIMKPKIKKEI